MKLNLFNISPIDFSKDAKKLLLSKFNYFEFNKKEKFLKEIHNCDILFTRIEFYLDKNILSNAKKLKLISTNTTGLDHIDQIYAKNKKIKVISLNDCRRELNKISASAEFTWAILLSLTKKIPEAHGLFRKKLVSRHKFKGTQIKNKTIGIVGMGRNGQQIKRYAKSFKLQILSWDKFNTKKNNCSLNFLLKESDIIVLCIPLNKKNVNFFDKKKLFKMKKNSILINTSRGEILDEISLLKLLQNKHISGAALDVLQKKNGKYKNYLKIKKYLSKNENLIITPHIAGVTKESWQQSEIILAKKLIKIF